MRYENVNNASSLANDSPFLLVNRNSALHLQRQTLNLDMNAEVIILVSIFNYNHFLILIANIDRFSLAIPW